MKSDCSSDVKEEVFYYLQNTFFLPQKVSFILTFGMMYFLLVIQIMKVQTQTNVPFKEALKMFLQIFIFSLSLILTFLESIEAIGKSDFNNILKLIFVICYSNELIKTFQRLYLLTTQSGGLILLLIFSLLVGGAFFRVLYYGEEIGQSGIIFSYSFHTFFRSFETFMITIMFGNLPDLIQDSLQVSQLYTFLLLAYNLFIFAFIFGYFAGGVGDNLMNQYLISLRKVASNYPQSKNLIQQELKTQFYDPGSYDKVKALLSKEHSNRTKEEREGILQSAMAKFRRAVFKLRTLKSISSTNESLVIKLFKEVNNTFVYNTFIFFLAFFIVLQPIFVLDRTFINEVTECYNMSQLLSLVFVVELVLIYKSDSIDFWNFINTVEVISCMGTILMANLLYLLPTHYSDKDVVGYPLLYLVWGSFCLLKLFRITKILMEIVKFKVIIKLCLDLMPILQQIILIFSMTNLVYSTISMFLYGGMLNTNFIEQYERVTGDVIDESYLLFNINDLINSFLYFLNIAITFDFFSLVTNFQVLQYIVDPKPWKLFLIKIFCYSFFIVMELCIFQILIIFIAGLLDVYQANTNEELKKQEEVKRNQDIVDLFLDRERFDGEEKSYMVEEEY